MLLMAAGNVPVKELLAKLMLCKSEVLFIYAKMSFWSCVLITTYAEHNA